MAKSDFEPKAYLAYLALRAVLGLPKLLPYRARIKAIGWLTSTLVAPLAGYRKRVRNNLRLIFPDMDPAEIKRLERAVPNNAGRVLAELFSSDDFVRHLGKLELTGPGVDALIEAREAGRPIIGVSGHFGNYDVMRLAMVQNGFSIGALYRPFANKYFDLYYRNALETVAKPVFPQGRRGLTEMLRHLKSGNMIAILADQRADDGEMLSFFGQDALTPISTAEMALKYDAQVFCAYGVRRENGVDFDMVIEKPIPHGDPNEMMQAINDSLEAQVRQNMDQFLWIHNRWQIPTERQNDR
ncbi:lysophospholipid acyltransferase family protein [Aliiroseovarius sp. KMU-50]|uniref:Lysophospholipid acyltransferase family protein n=1 Tax=Aliiroseovarius salicola TaxID=3009082 RepID=A0ABT4W045_9RHOB|nr:lysophospholipid acyltransferase family protein [Aliiroseovarius sp. KMU-50]MDA5093886.1 lysophospholipid acyltransferase family protein [Aliiroseovarius sp. KMU-50]